MTELENRVLETIERVESQIKRANINLDDNNKKNVRNNLKKSKQELDILKRYLKRSGSINELPLTIEDLKECYEEICNKYYKDRNWSLFSNHRLRSYNYLRKCFFEMGRKHYYISSIALGKLSNRTHGTVLHAVNTEIIDDEFEDIKEVLKQNNLYY